MAARKTLTSILPALMCLAVLCVLTACDGSVPDYRTDKPCGVNDMNEPITYEQVLQVMNEYRALLWRQRNVHGFGPTNLKDEDGNETDQLVIQISVTKKVDQSSLPPEDQIPDCLGGVPVIWEEEPEGQLGMDVTVEAEEGESDGTAE